MGISRAALLSYLAGSESSLSAISNRCRVGNTPATHDHGRFYRCLWQICWRTVRRFTLSYFYLFSSVAMDSFCQLLNSWSASVVGNTQLVSKIYFPRLILPLSGVLSPVADFGVAFVILIGMMVWFGISPAWGILALPLLVLLAILTALAIGLWLSALDVRYRDVGHAVPFLVQIWMFITPVTYPVSLVPEKWRLLYSLNPMTGVIEGFRWALLGQQSPDFAVITASAVMMFMLLITGIVYFRYTERTFADVI